MTEAERYRETPHGAVEMAAADLTARTSALFNRARQGSPVTQKEVAELLGVTDGRVSQVLGGDGNVTVAALAKYLRALGYNAEIVTTPARDDVPEINMQPRRRRRDTDETPEPAKTEYHEEVLIVETTQHQGFMTGREKVRRSNKWHEAGVLRSGWQDSSSAWTTHHTTSSVISSGQ